MAGYSGYSMSNNAVECYENNIKPKSKWSKNDIINAIIELDILTKDEIIELKKLKLSSLKSFLAYDSYHHTSSMYNTTNFYRIDDNVGLEIILNLQNYEKREKEKNKDKKIVKSEIIKEFWVCNYFVWDGTRKHPKAVEKRDIFELNNKNNKARNITDYKNKMTNSNGFKKIKKLDINENRISFIIENKKFKKKEYKTIEYSLKAFFEEM